MVTPPQGWAAKHKYANGGWTQQLVPMGATIAHNRLGPCDCKFGKQLLPPQHIGRRVMQCIPDVHYDMYCSQIELCQTQICNCGGGVGKHTRADEQLLLSGMLRFYI